MTFIPRDDTIYATSNSGADQDGILVVVVLKVDSILAVGSERIKQFKQGQELGDNLAAFGINIFLIFKLLPGKIMDIRNLFGGNTAGDLLVGDCEKNLFAGITPGLSILENINDDIGVK